jgi:hypothetical protein
MKKLFYRLSSSLSFVKLFSILACVALGCLFAQQAVAQCDPTTDPSCFVYGWEPFPPSSWDGGWDPDLLCDALPGGTTTLTRTLPNGPDTVVQDGTVSCTFRDPANTTCGSPNCGPTGFKATATCSLHVEIDNLSESCVTALPNGPSTVTVTGTCPVATIPLGKGTIDCTGAPFCSYAGSDPTGNTNFPQCVWNLGWGAKQGSKVVPLTQKQCQAAFGSSQEVFSFSQTLESCSLNAQVVKMGQTSQNYCHSDTWNPSQAPFCAFPKGAVKNTATGTVENFLTADTQYSPTSINTACTPSKDQGPITLIVLGNNNDPGTNPIDVQAINQDTITVNGRAVTSCGLLNPDTLRCKVPSCQGGESIIAPGTNTLQMDACIGDRNPVGADPCTVTHVVGELVHTKTSP